MLRRNKNTSKDNGMSSSWKEILAAEARNAGLKPQVDRFFFLRHGETDYNRQHIVQGWADIPLNEKGIAQAQVAARSLQGQGITHIHASPLSRARRTAEIVSAALAAPINGLDARLREKGFGEYEHHPDPDPSVWMRQDNGAETYAAFAGRIVAGLNDSLTDGVPLVVAHGGSRRVLLWALGLDVKGAAMGNAVPLELQRVSSEWRINVLTSLPGEVPTWTP